MTPITEPQVDHVDYDENGPLKFHAIFEVLPEFELGAYKDLEVEIQASEVTDADVEKTLQESRERAATFVPVEGRALAKGDPWTAWYSYDAARYLLLPVDFLSSPNLDKLHQEQALVTPSPQSAFPLSLADGDRTWKIEAVGFDPTLREADLGVVYQSTGVTDPAALRTEATAVLSAFLKVQPGIRANFHGLWAYAEKDGKRSPVMELPMDKIP